MRELLGKGPCHGGPLVEQVRFKVDLTCNITCIQCNTFSLDQNIRWLLLILCNASPSLPLNTHTHTYILLSILYFYLVIGDPKVYLHPLILFFLYLNRRFLKGHNFMPWFQRRRVVAEQEQHKLWRKARMKTEIKQFLSTMSELEIVDSFNAIERHLLEEIQVALLMLTFSL